MSEGHDLDRLSGAPEGEQVPLPEARRSGPVSLEETVTRRRSCRDYTDESLDLDAISQLLWSAQGFTSPEGLRAAPSAGACYPLEVYLACAQGLFRYRPRGHTLEKTQADDIRGRLAEAAFGQSFVAEAPVSLIFAAIYARTTERYGERGIRYVHIDVGHAAENVHLQAEAMGLGSCAVGAFDDAGVARALRLPAEQRPVYIVPVGRPRRG